MESIFSRFFSVLILVIISSPSWLTSRASFWALTCRVLISVDGISGDAKDYAVAANGASQLAFAEAAVAGLSFKVVENTYI